MNDFSVRVVFAEAGSDEPCENQADHAALHMNDRRACEINMPVTQAKIHPQLRKPATAPNPVAEQRIHECSNTATIDHKGRELPSLRRRACWDCGGRVHEHHLEQEQGKSSGIIPYSLQQKTLVAKQAKRFPKNVDRQFTIQSSIVSQGGDRA